MSAKKTKVAGRKSSSESPVHSADGGESKMPTDRDVAFVRSQPVPPPSNERVIRNVVDGFTPTVRKTLLKPEVVEFYGSRVKPRQIVEDTELAEEALSVELRLRHGADRAKQVGDPAQLRLMDQASRIMRDLNELVAEHPNLADGLQDLADWWSTAFPGGGAKAKPNGNGSGETKGGAGGSSGGSEKGAGGGAGGTAGGNGGPGGSGGSTPV